MGATIRILIRVKDKGFSRKDPSLTSWAFWVSAPTVEDGPECPDHLVEKIPFVLRTSGNLGAVVTAPLGSSARWVLERSLDLSLPFLVTETSGSIGDYVNELKHVYDMVGIDYLA